VDKRLNTTLDYIISVGKEAFQSTIILFGPALWSSGQSSWLQIQRSQV
jgi:hypothetical protein